MPTPLAGGLENSFAPQMIFLWPPARGVGKKYCKNIVLSKKYATFVLVCYCDIYCNDCHL